MSENINQEILVELRRLKRLFYLILIFVIIGTAPSFYAGFTRGSTSANSWERVRSAMNRQDFPAALSMSRTLVDSQPNYYYGHAFLGAIYLAMATLQILKRITREHMHCFPMRKA